MINSENRRIKLKMHIQDYIASCDELTMTEAIEVLSGLINMGMQNMLKSPGTDEVASVKLT